MTLPCAGTSDNRVSSKPAVETAQWAFTFCSQNGIPAQAIRSGDDSSECPALSYIQSSLCDSLPAQPAADITNASESVRLFENGSILDECTHVAGAILRAVRNGYRYREMSLVLTDFERYAPVLEAVFSRYDIPLYLSSRKEDISHKAIMLAINFALDSATHGMQKEDVLGYLKTGLSNLDQQEVALLENYVMTWNIHGRAWEPVGDAWTMHPDGFGMMATEGSNERLAVVNELRERGVGPLIRLKDSLRAGETLGDHVASLNSFLAEIDFTGKLQSIVDTLANSGNMQTAQEYAQVFDVLDAAMAKMSDVAGHIKGNGGGFIRAFPALRFDFSWGQMTCLSLSIHPARDSFLRRMPWPLLRLEQKSPERRSLISLGLWRRFLSLFPEQSECWFSPTTRKVAADLLPCICALVRCSPGWRGNTELTTKAFSRQT